MNDYISRERLILQLNDWMLQNAPVKDGDDPTRADTILDAIKMVEDSPAADVVEVVRCRECCRYDPETHYCENTGCEWDPWEFCSDGERKDGDDNG